MSYNFSPGDGNVSFEEFVEIVSNIGGASTAAPTDQHQEEQELRDAFRVSEINAIPRRSFHLNLRIAWPSATSPSTRSSDKFRRPPRAGDAPGYIERNVFSLAIHCYMRQFSIGLPRPFSVNFLSCARGFALGVS